MVGRRTISARSRIEVFIGGREGRRGILTNVLRDPVGGRSRNVYSSRVALTHVSPLASSNPLHFPSKPVHRAGKSAVITSKTRQCYQLAAESIRNPQLDSLANAIV